MSARETPRDRFLRWFENGGEGMYLDEQDFIAQAQVYTSASLEALFGDVAAET